MAAFSTCPDCGGTRLSEAARSSRIAGVSIADACAMQISDLAGWIEGIAEPSLAPLLQSLRGLLAAFVQIGLVPNSDFLDGVVERSRFGEIVINEKCQTSQEGIYACGDVTTVPYKQIVIAMGEGSKASLAAFDYLMTQGDRLEDLYEGEQNHDEQQDAAVA